jgi:hypothetical protein
VRAAAYTTQVPLYGYANGCWIGDVPSELQGLTFLEEQCISRARATRCTIKLEKGPSGQYASHGNVCIFPQEPRALAEVLPPPINVFYDEIAVIFVSSPDATVTEESLSKSPLLVRRKRILDALQWLKANNPLYKEVRIAEETLLDYPEHGPEAFENNQGSVPISAHGILDTDQVDATYKMCKLEAMRMLKASTTPFVKFASGNTPIQTSYNPSMYGSLWPTLYSYGREEREFVLVLVSSKPTGFSFLKVILVLA